MLREDGSDEVHRRNTHGKFPTEEACSHVSSCVIEEMSPVSSAGGVQYGRIVESMSFVEMEANH